MGRFAPRTALKAVCLVGLSLLHAIAGHCTTIDYTVTHSAGNRWRYDYQVHNNSLTERIAELTIFFDVGSYSDLLVSASPTDWDSLVVQPDTRIPADGFFDALARTGGIDRGAALAGFSVSFEYLLAGRPGAQRFDIDNVNFQAIDSGLTTDAVDEPSILVFALTALSLLPLVSRYRRIRFV